MAQEPQQMGRRLAVGSPRCLPTFPLPVAAPPFTNPYPCSFQSGLLQSLYSKTTPKAKAILDKAAALGVLHLLVRNTNNPHIINMFCSPFTGGANAAKAPPPPPQQHRAQAVDLVGELWDSLSLSRVEEVEGLLRQEKDAKEVLVQLQLEPVCADFLRSLMC